MKKQVIELKANNLFTANTPTLTAAEQELLKKNLMTESCREPLVVCRGGNAE